ncbi:U-box domain-containing protein 52-like [Canna indica]|uniref:RING-type E3 ubiquitin transferase n=1 Tax=Canna indica TaxID=4628 RepID=A0AAQ3L3R7_9LILI|nr:U-box domain-containing protein 52-like [Canna indica]
MVAVAIDKNKGSQNAVKWAADNLVLKGQTLTLIHVNNRNHSSPADHQTKEIFLPFHCFCMRKDINCKDVVLGSHNVAKAINEFVSHAAIEKLVVGAPAKGGFVRRFKHHDITINITKGAPDFCSVYVIGKGKVSAMRNASRPAPATSPLRDQLLAESCLISLKGAVLTSPLSLSLLSGFSLSRMTNSGRTMSRCSATKSFAELCDTDLLLISTDTTDISFVNSEQPSSENALSLRSGSEGIDQDFVAMQTPYKYTGNDFSLMALNTDGMTWSPQKMEAVEEEMKRLKLELKHTMDMYNTACKEALTEKQKAKDLQRWKIQEEKKISDAHVAEEAATAMVEKERAKCTAALEAAQAEHRLAELEAQKRIDLEMKLAKEDEEKKKALLSLAHGDVRYRKFTIEEIEAATESFADHCKIGEGSYGPVYKCYLDHTAVAIKVLRPEAAGKGRSEFHQEAELLSCIRHPNVVLLLGACPEHGSLVYEYMANGSLEERLFRKGGTPVIPWQFRFQIAAEITTGLLYLHHMRPEPLVHRDLKPANILLDKNYVGKISDVGLARVVPSSVADNITRYRMTSVAGTLYYIDPEYQQTGMLGVKSDIYSLGVVLLQIITARPPMGLAHHVSSAIEDGTFAEMLDPEVCDWPVEEARCLAEIALKCTELRRKDRPDLATTVMPELDRLRAISEDNMLYCKRRS